MRKTSEEIREGYRARLNLPEFPPEGEPVEFRTKSGTLVAVGYKRVVIGDRGPYVEFAEDQMVHDKLEIPKDQKWRLLWIEPDPQRRCYYWELRSIDKARVKVYVQQRTVDYADYKLGMWYISPFDLVTDRWSVLVEPLPKEQE
jgi:hypothetical protein